MTALYMNQLPTVTALLAGDFLPFSRDGFDLKKITLDNLFTNLPVPVSLASTLAVSGVSSFAAGTAALPSITSIGDPNTGLWFPAADTWAVSTSGVERIRIDSAGRMGLGAVPLTNTRMYASGTHNYAAASIGSRLAGTIDPSVVTSEFSSFVSNPAVSAGTLPDFEHYVASAGVFTGTVNRQYGFYVIAGLTGATTNYGFYGNIPAGANRYNFYAAGTADNYFAGSLGIGIAPAATSKIYSYLTGSSTSAADTNAVFQVNTNAASGSTQKLGVQGITYIVTGYGGTGNIIGTQGDVILQDAVTASATYGVRSKLTTSAAGTLTSFSGFATSIANSGSATISTVFGLNIQPHTVGTTNYGAYCGLAAASNTYNFYAAGTADNYFAGSVGVGTTTLTGYSLHVGKNITGAVTSFGIRQAGVVQSDVTTEAIGISSFMGQAAGFTLPDMEHFYVAQGTIAGTVTRQYGYYVSSNLTGGTNNYSFHGNMAAGANRWNFYAAGSANNAYAGNSSFGKVTAPIAAVDTNSIALGFATNSGATCSVGATDCTIIQTTQASVYTLPAAASYPNRILNLVTQFAGTVTSASSNVVPLAGGAAGTAILAATAGKYATLQSNGTNWVIIAAN